MTEYSIFRREGYGAGERFGNKYWVDIIFNQDELSFEDSCTALPKALVDEFGDKPVYLGSHEFPAKELTFFFYDNRQPLSDTDNWIADKVITISLDDEAGDGDDEYAIQGETAVIWDTIEDLPKLDSMSNDARLRWYGSLSELERSQLAHVCGIYIGVAISHPMVMAGNLDALHKLGDMDFISVFSKEMQRKQRPRKPAPRRRRRR